MVRLAALRDRLWAALSGAFPEAQRHGDPQRTLPNTLSLGLPGVTASDVLRELGDEVAASAGAACHAEGVSVSTVLEAMGVPEDLAVGTIRLSVGRTTTEGEVDEAAAILIEALRAHVSTAR
jgi:cysteine desulfurase